MKIEKRTAVLLCIILAACSLCSAQAASFREAVPFFTGSRDIHFELETEIKKLPQFSEERTGQLNRLLKHITVKGTTGEHQSEASFLLDGRLLFSMIRTDSEEKPVSMIAPDPLYYYILPEDSETGKESVSELSNDLDALLRNISFLETLDARYRVQSANALKLAKKLQKLKSIKSVNYIGLPDNPYYERAQRQFGPTGGAMLTIDLADRDACFSFLNRLQLILRATNLFDNKTLAIHPASTIFGNFTNRQLSEVDVKQTTIRLSVGLEDVNDIFKDIKQALG